MDTETMQQIVSEMGEAIHTVRESAYKRYDADDFGEADKLFTAANTLSEHRAALIEEILEKVNLTS